MDERTELRIYCDPHRNLICVPYSIEHLHAVASMLKIKRKYFAATHYQVPAYVDIRHVERLSTKELISIIEQKAQDYTPTPKIR